MRLAFPKEPRTAERYESSRSLTAGGNPTESFDVRLISERCGHPCAPESVSPDLKTERGEISIVESCND
jgi:hypothetical protein